MSLAPLDPLSVWVWVFKVTTQNRHLVSGTLFGGGPRFNSIMSCVLYRFKEKNSPSRLLQLSVNAPLYPHSQLHTVLYLQIPNRN